MEDNRKKLIQFVRDQPLIWDPKHPDYHNKDQRKQVWEDIDNKCPPTGTNTNSKTTWESLTKSFSNALRRKSSKPSCSSDAGTEREWKYTKDMMFLLPVKTTRKTSGNFVVPVPGLEYYTTMDCYNVDNEEKLRLRLSSRSTFQSHPDVADSQSQPNEVVDDQPSQDEIQIKTETDTTTAGSQTQTDYVESRILEQEEPPKKRKLVVVQKPDGDDTDTTNSNTVLEIIVKQQQHQQQLDNTSNDYPRLNFFRSIMPSVDSLDDDGFVSFQMDVLQALQRRRRVVVHHSGACCQQQQQTPNPDNNLLSEAPSDS